MKVSPKNKLHGARRTLQKLFPGAARRLDEGERFARDGSETLGTLILVACAAAPVLASCLFKAWTARPGQLMLPGRAD